MNIKNELLVSYGEDLHEIKQIIEKNLKSGEKNFNLLLQDLAATEGKMLRAILVLISSGFGSIDRKKKLHLAALIEILHLSTLIHDDIIDASTLRRGKPTLQSKHGVNAALYMGDFLFSSCYILLSQYASLETIEKGSKSIRYLCKGEINQFYSLYGLDSSVKNYLKRISGKTASLFALSLYIGAAESTADLKVQKKLSQIGHHIGMAFQIIDDLLDLTATEEVLGKPAAADLKQGIYCLPIIYELKAQNEELKALLENKQYEKVSSIIINSEGLEKTKTLAKRYTGKAISLIQTLPECREKALLHITALALLDRKY